MIKNVTVNLNVALWTLTFGIKRSNSVQSHKYLGQNVKYTQVMPLFLSIEASVTNHCILGSLSKAVMGVINEQSYSSWFLLYQMKGCQRMFLFH